MKVHYLPRDQPLEITVRKMEYDAQVPSFVLSTKERNEYAETIRRFKLQGTEAHSPSRAIFLSKFPFNGILLSERYVYSLFRQNGTTSDSILAASFASDGPLIDEIIDRSIIESKIIKDIPVLFSRRTVDGGEGSKDGEDFVRSHFDHVYTIDTEMKLVGPTYSYRGMRIALDAKLVESTRLIYSIDTHPIEQWKNMMKKTNRVRLELRLASSESHEANL